MRPPASDLPVVFDGVTVRAGASILLDTLNLSINAGPPTLIVGPNGAGKSSLLRLCMGLIAPSVGRVTWGGLANVAPTHRAILFQSPVMLRRSAVANVSYALKHAGYPREKLAGRERELMARVGLEGLEKRAARQLSGGEQQRLALARAFARDPDLLLLDEPTANLDPAATRAVEDIIRDTAQSGIKVVMATHDLGQVRRLAGEVIFMLRGGVREQSPVEHFLDHPTTAEAAAFVRGDLVI